VQSLETVATSTTATAKSVETLQTTVGTNTASIQTAQSSINGINAQWTLKADVNGLVGGIGLANDGNVIDLLIRANNIGFLPPVGGDDGVSQLVIRNTTSVIDGVTVPPGLYTRNFYAPRGSIDTIQVKVGAIKSAQIDSLAVKSGNIDNLAVTTGKIANLAVDTLKIADYAVTIPRVQFTAAEYNFTATNTEFEINRLTLNAAGGTVGISFGFEKLSASQFGLSTGATVTIRIRRVGASAALRTLVFPSKLTPTRDVKVSQVNGNSKYTLEYDHRLSYEYVSIPIYLDTPPAGDQTYIVTVEGYGVNENQVGVSISARTLHLMGVKK